MNLKVNYGEPGKEDIIMFMFSKVSPILLYMSIYTCIVDVHVFLYAIFQIIIVAFIHLILHITLMHTRTYTHTHTHTRTHARAHTHSLSPVMMDAQGWNECTATHRAVTEGNISILRVSTSTNVHILHVHLLHVHFTTCTCTFTTCAYT